jgi:hypothetical protein
MCLPISRLFWVSSLAYPNLLGTKGYVVVVVVVVVLADPERSCCLVAGRFSFAPCEERHVHHNHMVGAVRLIGVYG